MSGDAQGQGQLPGILDDDSPIAWIGRLYEAVNAAVEEYGGQDALAADAGLSRQTLNQKLRRALDSKGDTQRLHLDVLGHLFSGSTGKAARWAFAVAVCRMVGAKDPEPVRTLTAEERAQLLAALVSDKAKRAAEREAGLPSGSLG